MTPEHAIQNDIRIWCGAHDMLCFRCNVGRVRTSDGKWFDTGLPSGFSDLLILAGGKVYFCEVKAPYGRLRPDQAAFRDEVVRRGYDYFVARSIEDVAAHIPVSAP